MTDHYLYAKPAKRFSFAVSNVKKGAGEFQPALARSTRLLFIAYLVLPGVAASAALALLILR